MIRKRLSLPRRFLLAGLPYLLVTASASVRGADQPAQITSPTDGIVSLTPVAETPEMVSAPKTPIEFRGLLNLGASLTERGDFEAAEIAYRQILKADNATLNDTKSALLGFAHMHRRKGALIKAVAIYEKYLQQFPGDERTPDALLDLGRALRDMGTYKLAINRFYSVINSTLKMPAEGFEHYQVLAKTAQFEIAETHFLAGNFAEAAKFFDRLRLSDLAPVDRARAHFKAACAQHRAGDFTGAALALRGYLTQWPDDPDVPEARYLLAVSLRAMDRPQEAFAATLELLRTEKSRVESNPKRWAYWQGRTGNQLANDFFENGDTLNAHAIYASLIGLSPELTWRLPVTYQLALCYERLGMTDRAQSSYRTIVEAAGVNPAPEIAEIVNMATWRLNHLAWREKIGQQITKFFQTTTGQHAVVVPVIATSAIP